MAESERLIVVSNRLPVTLRWSGERWKTEQSSGGLATAMNPLLKQTNGIWIGWSGESSDPSDPERQAVIRSLAENEGCIAVDLPAEMAQLYYEGYANQTLWPLFHHFTTFVSFQPEAWRAYMEANQRFRDVVVENYKPGDSIWVHDYHLMLLPQMLRESLPDAAIGFFLHIPFPSSEVFRILPRRDELLNGLLGADLLAFHTHSHVQHFRNSLLRILGAESRFDEVEAGGRAVRLEALPIGIAPEDFVEALQTPEGARYQAELQRRFRGSRILLAVDRLDYTKGIPERLRTYRRLLQLTPELATRVVLIQVAVPSREHVSTYAQLNRDVNELVGEINGEFGTPDWTPLVYIRRGLERPQLAALYASADVAWVTPLRDGMNLVAKEYVACKPDGNGALVLSEFAGAAEEMGEAFSVNPYDEERTAEMLQRVLALSPEEGRDRMAALRGRVLRNNVYAWGNRFLKLVREAVATRREKPSPEPLPLARAEIVEAYRSASRRALFLDYDGTLVGYAPRPEGAVPDQALLTLLERLAGDASNLTVLISGRRRRDLDTWFGHIRGLWMAAEHGALLRRPGSDWAPLRADLPAEWKARIRPVLEHYVERAPGSLIEDKEFSIAWHYRMSDPEFGNWLANELTSTLEGMLSETELRALKGRKVVEVKPHWADKGEVVQHVLEVWPNADFRFAVGDDRTDEDMFGRLDEAAWTIHVGPGASRARYRLPKPASLRTLLEQFAAGHLAAGG